MPVAFWWAVLAAHLLTGLVGVLRKRFGLITGNIGSAFLNNLWWAAAGLAGCLERALLAELMRVIRGALFSWKAGHLKAYLLLCGLGACMHSLELAGGFGGRLVGTVGGLPWRRTF